MLKTIVFFHESVVAETTLTCFLFAIFDFGTFFTRRARTFWDAAWSENYVSVGRQISLTPQSRGRVCSEICKMRNFHVGVVPKRSQKLQIVECWSRNRKFCEKDVFFKNLRIFTQISRSPILVFFLL